MCRWSQGQKMPSLMLRNASTLLKCLVFISRHLNHELTCGCYFLLISTGQPELRNGRDNITGRRCTFYNIAMLHQMVKNSVFQWDPGFHSCPLPEISDGESPPPRTSAVPPFSLKMLFTFAEQCSGQQWSNAFRKAAWLKPWLRPS